MTGAKELLTNKRPEVKPRPRPRLSLSGAWGVISNFNDGMPQPHNPERIPLPPICDPKHVPLIRDMLAELKRTTIIFSDMGGFCCVSCYGHAIWIDDDTPSETEAEHKPDCKRAAVIARAERLIGDA